MKGTLFIIGVGPGDPELLTIKATMVMKKCPVVATPCSSKENKSTALSIAEQVVDLSTKTICQLYFPMQKIHGASGPSDNVRQAWHDAAVLVGRYLEQGDDVAFPTLGDPAIYSTGFYLYETILGLYPEARVKIIPGIPAMSSCSATTGIPICLGDDKLAVIPATFSHESVRETLINFDTIVLMKVHKVIPELIDIFLELDLINHSLLVERAGMADERVHMDLTMLPASVHYFSTIIVRKRMQTSHKALKA